MKDPHNGCVRTATKKNVHVLTLWIDPQLGSVLSSQLAERHAAAESMLMTLLFLLY